MRPQHETDFAVAWVFGDEDGRKAAEEMDATVGELPGLEGIRIARDALDATLRRLGRGPDPGRMPTPLAAFRT